MRIAEKIKLPEIPNKEEFGEGTLPLTAILNLEKFRPSRREILWISRRFFRVSLLPNLQN